MIEESSSSVVWFWFHVSAATRRRSFELYSAPPPFAELRIAAYMNWHAALWRLIARFFGGLHSCAMCVHESGR